MIKLLQFIWPHLWTQKPENKSDQCDKQIKLIYFKICGKPRNLQQTAGLEKKKKITQVAIWRLRIKSNRRETNSGHT